MEVLKGLPAWQLKEKEHYGLIPPNKFKIDNFPSSSSYDQEQEQELNSSSSPVGNHNNGSSTDRVIIQNYHFTCPRHLCDSCSLEYPHHIHQKEMKGEQLFACVYCPRAFHVKCFPPFLKCNEYCLVCPLHPEKLIPGIAKDVIHIPLLQSLENDVESCSSSSLKSVKADQQRRAEEQEIHGFISSFYNSLPIPRVFATRHDREINEFKLPFSIIEEMEEG
jgi:hypothetical protein